MAYVVTVIWKAKEGQEEEVAEKIEKMTPLSLDEPGCLFYQAHRSVKDGNPGLFFLYEQYVDEAAFEAHMATPHFKRYVEGGVYPKLKSREPPSFYKTM